MANLLILTDDIPYPQDFSGSAARVLPLSRALATEHRCRLVALTRDAGREAGLLATGIFAGCDTIPFDEGVPAFGRYAYFRTGHLARRRTPREYAAIVRALAGIARERQIDAVVAHGLKVAEFAAGVDLKTRVFDATDCITLTAKRRFAVERQRHSLLESLRARLNILRIALQERDYIRRFDATCLASPVDLAFMRRLCAGDPARVQLIPNGVAESFLSRPGPEQKTPERAVVFWGALDFHPNKTSVRWFHDHVYRPFLRGKGIRWYLIGRGAPEDIRSYPKADPDIVVTGFIDDLPSFLGRIPVVINPMQAGSGIKNKVLEAFALGKAVVSNRMGIESIAARPDEHFAAAETPEEFCRQIELLLADGPLRERLGGGARRLVEEHYDWQAIGLAYRRLVGRALLVEGGAGSRRTRPETA